ncbi:MAG: hypothetical protein M1817_003067 [Caeruleum heppii]|nr:MAG: hypothetical protein M1817_003067 [Caeruleum heppii]
MVIIRSQDLAFMARVSALTSAFLFLTACGASPLQPGQLKVEAVAAAQLSPGGQSQILNQPIEPPDTSLASLDTGGTHAGADCQVEEAAAVDAGVYRAISWAEAARNALNLGADPSGRTAAPFYNYFFRPEDASRVDAVFAAVQTISDSSTRPMAIFCSDYLGRCSSDRYSYAMGANSASSAKANIVVCPSGRQLQRSPHACVSDSPMLDLGYAMIKALVQLPQVVNVPGITDLLANDIGDDNRLDSGAVNNADNYARFATWAHHLGWVNRGAEENCDGHWEAFVQANGLVPMGGPEVLKGGRTGGAPVSSGTTDGISTATSSPASLASDALESSSATPGPVPLRSFDMPVVPSAIPSITPSIASIPTPDVSWALTPTPPPPSWDPSVVALMASLEASNKALMASVPAPSTSLAWQGESTTASTSVAPERTEGVTVAAKAGASGLGSDGQTVRVNVNGLFREGVGNVRTATGMGQIQVG